MCNIALSFVEYLKNGPYSSPIDRLTKPWGQNRFKDSYPVVPQPPISSSNLLFVGYCFSILFAR